MRTLFITSFNPFISRNILATDVFKILKADPDLRVVIFVPDYKVDYFRQRYASSNVIIEGLPAERISRQDVFFTYLGSSLVNSKTLAIHKLEKFTKDKNIFKFLLSFLLRAFCGRFNAVKKLIRWTDLKSINAASVKGYFEKYSPTAVFATDVFNNDDIRFLAEAKKSRVKTIGMIRSWDNITTKGVFRVKPDELVVHNEIIKQEATDHNDMEEEKIFVSGIPQYDRYIKGTRMSRAEFFGKIGLDPNKKLVLYSPFGGRFYKYDWQIMEILKELNVQVLVRLTPNDKVDLSRFKPTPLFYIDQPGRQFQKDYFRDTELDEKDLDWLADSLYHSDVLVACGASIVVDIAIFDKPAVLVFFDGQETRPYLQSAKRWLDLDHAKRIWKDGGAKAARNKEELLRFVKAYLENPRLDREKRRLMALEQSWKLDGNSGKRIAEFLINCLQNKYA